MTVIYVEETFAAVLDKRKPGLRLAQLDQPSTDLVVRDVLQWCVAL